MKKRLWMYGFKIDEMTKIVQGKLRGIINTNGGSK